MEQYSKMIGPWQLLALRENDTAIEVSLLLLFRIQLQHVKVISG